MNADAPSPKATGMIDGSGVLAVVLTISQAAQVTSPLPSTMIDVNNLSMLHLNLSALIYSVKFIRKVNNVL